MTLPQRSVLDQRLNTLNEQIIQMSSLVGIAIENAMASLYDRNITLAAEVIAADQILNELRYAAEDEALQILATQQPMAGDLRKVVAAIHIAVELERIGDHACGNCQPGRAHGKRRPNRIAAQIAQDGQTSEGNGEDGR